MQLQTVSSALRARNILNAFDDRDETAVKQQVMLSRLNGSTALDARECECMELLEAVVDDLERSSEPLRAMLTGAHRKLLAHLACDRPVGIDSIPARKALRPVPSGFQLRRAATPRQ